MAELEIRPQSVSQTIDAVFKIYLDRFVPLVTIALVVTAPVLVLQGIVNIGLVEAIESTDSEAITEFPDIWRVISPRDVTTSIILAVLGWIATALASGATIVVVADAYLGRSTAWQDALRRTVIHLGPLLLGSLLFALGVVAGFLMLIVPGIILAVGWGVFGPAVVIENLRGSAALGRSWRLTRGRRWPVLGALLVVFIIVTVISSVIASALTDSDDYTVYDVLVNVGINGLTAPLTAATAGVLYIELRARNEPFDRLLLSSELQRPEDPPSIIR